MATGTTIALLLTNPVLALFLLVLMFLALRNGKPKPKHNIKEDLHRIKEQINHEDE